MNSVKHTKSFVLAIPIQEIFPLFTPEGEKLWAPGWDYENIMGTTEISEDYIFLTKSHSHAADDAIWIVKKFNLETNFVQYYRIEPGDKVGIVTVNCSEVDDINTKVQVTYQYFALSQRGADFISGFTDTFYSDFIKEWQTHLVHYFNSKTK